jgi:hypothetical protein
MNKDINCFYSDLWNLEEKKQEEENLKKFQEEEKDINLFNERYKEDMQEVENTEKPLINRIVTIRQTWI